MDSSMRTFWEQCGLCEDESYLYFECKDGQQFICERCKLIHGKVLTLASHTVTDIRHNFSQQTIKVKFSHIPCGIHSQISCAKFCSSCDEPVCSECVKTVHGKHTMEELTAAGGKKLEDVLWCRACANFYSLRLKKDTGGLKKKTENWEEQISVARKLVDENEQVVIEAVKKYANKLRSSIDQKKLSRMELISDKEKDNSSKETELLSFVNLVDKTLESGEGELIFNAAKEGRKINSRFRNFSVPSELITVSPPDVSDETLLRVFGSIKHLSIPSKVKMELVLNSTLSGCIGTDKIAMCSDDSAWISAYSPNNKHSFLRREHFGSLSLFSRPKIVEMNVFDMALAPNDTLFASVHMTSQVHKVDKNGAAELFLDVSPLIVRGIHVTKENKILVGVREHASLEKRYDLSEESCRQVIVFNMQKQQQDVYEYDENKQRLFTIPTRICSGINNDIIVIYAKIEDQCVIKAIGRRTRNVQWTFIGGDVKKKNQSFHPDDIACSPSGLIVFTECMTNRLYVLSADGDLLAFKDVRRWNMILPKTISFDCKGLLRIGCGNNMLSRKDIKNVEDLPVLSCVKFEVL